MQRKIVGQLDHRPVGHKYELENRANLLSEFMIRLANLRQL